MELLSEKDGIECWLCLRVEIVKEVVLLVEGACKKWMRLTKVMMF